MGAWLRSEAGLLRRMAGVHITRVCHALLPGLAGCRSAPVERYGLAFDPYLLQFQVMVQHHQVAPGAGLQAPAVGQAQEVGGDRKSTRLNSSHSQISYA